ncbi:hypothetical protein NMG60_11015802 [Bertholletia excelsa]
MIRFSFINIPNHANHLRHCGPLIRHGRYAPSRLATVVPPPPQCRGTSSTPRRKLQPSILPAPPTGPTSANLCRPLPGTPDWAIYLSKALTTTCRSCCSVSVPFHHHCSLLQHRLV